jgi:hypothetical protein
MGQLSVCEGLAELWLKKRQESGRIIFTIFLCFWVQHFLFALIVSY